MAFSDTDRVYDELLVLQVKMGDRRAGERLVARWQPRLLRTARRVLRDNDAALDVVQDAWIGIFRGAAGLNDPTRFPAWAFGILHRKCVDRIRLEQRQRRAGEAEEATAMAEYDAEDSTAIRQAMARLSADQRIAAILHFGEGLTLAEVASATAVPLGHSQIKNISCPPHARGDFIGRRTVTDTDTRIRAALTAEDEAYLDDLARERGMFAQTRELFRGPMARWVAAAAVIAIVFTGLGAWTFFRMIEATDTRSLILWTAATACCVLVIMMIKLWAWLRIELLGILRELKVIELRLARLEER